MTDAAVFDEIHDCQEAFRQLLRAFSHPGEPVRILPYPDSSGRVTGSRAVLLKLALTLLDKESSFLSADDGEFSRMVADLTYSGQTAFLPQFLFVAGTASGAKMVELLALAASGTLEEPHQSTTLLIAVESITGESRGLLSGPGIQGRRSTCLSPYARQWLQARDAMEYEYPTGVDFIFASPDGSCMAIPRKIVVEG